MEIPHKYQGTPVLAEPRKLLELLELSMVAVAVAVAVARPQMAMGVRVVLVQQDL